MYGYMKKSLDDWLIELRTENISVHQKKDIYEKILIKKRFSSNFSKIAVRSWVAFFSVILVFMMSLVFIWTPSKPSREIDQIGEGFVGVILDSDQWIVYADSIWKIIETSGEVELFHDGVSIEFNELRHSDRILLHEWAEIVFLVRNDVQAKIFGPAEFELLESVAKDLYTIRMIRGTYVELTSVEKNIEDSNNIDKEITPSLVEKEQIENKIGNSDKEPFQVLVVTHDVEFKTSSSHEHIDLVVHNKDWHQIVQNIGGPVTVKKSIDIEGTITTIENHQIASIQSDISIFDAKEAIKQSQDDLYEQIELWKFKIVYTSSIDFDDVDLPNTVVEEKVVSLDAVIPSVNIKKADSPVWPENDIDNITADNKNLISSDVSDDFVWSPDSVAKTVKRVINANQLSVYESTIWSSVTKELARQILVSTYQWSTWSLSAAMKKVQISLSALSYSFSLDYTPSASSVSSLMNSVQIVKEKINEKYYVSPSMDSQFDSLTMWLWLSSKIVFWSSNDCDISCLQEALSLSYAEKTFLMSQ